MKNKGFTLIELLVVIAIIGVLGSVVLASLSTTRSKGNDAAIKANLANMRSQAELLYATNGDYNEVCGAASATQDPRVLEAITEADKRNGSGTVTCGAPSSGNASGWAIAADFDESGAFCVDSDGTARSSDSSGTAYTSDLGGVTPALSGATDVVCN
jgi:type IV pilus assembly protein PilA